MIARAAPGLDSCLQYAIYGTVSTFDIATYHAYVTAYVHKNWRFVKE